MTLQKTATELLSQLIELIDATADSEYSDPIDILSNASIGQHIRHTLEFFECLQSGLEKGQINYDNRRHDVNVEVNRELAISRLQGCVSFLKSCKNDQSLTLKSDYSLNGTQDVEIQTSLMREIAYNIEHAVHHMALIKIGVRSFERKVALPDNFGVAVSTVRYRLSTQN